MNMDFHVARGKHGPHETGMNGRVRVERDASGKLVGIFQLDTDRGPIALSATLEGARALPLRAAIAKLTGEPSLAGHGTLAGHEGRAYAYGRSRNLPAPQRPILPAQARVSGEETRPYGLPERVYAKLLEKDPRAVSLVQNMIRRAQAGDAGAMKFWGALCHIHAKAKALDFTTATPQERAAAERMHLRLAKKDPAAWTELSKIMSLVKQGDPGALRAWKLLCMEDEKAKAAQAAGIGVSIPPERVRQLLQIVTMARYAPAPVIEPPVGMYPGEPSPAAPPPASPPVNFWEMSHASPTRSIATATPTAVAMKESVTPVINASRTSRVTIRGVG